MLVHRARVHSRVALLVLAGPFLLLVARTAVPAATVCIWSDIDCMSSMAKASLQGVTIGGCALTDVDCLARKAEQSARLGNCTIIDTDCLTKQVERVRVVGINCTIADSECLANQTTAAAARLTSQAKIVAHDFEVTAHVVVTDSRKTLEAALGCGLSDQQCLRRRQEQATAQASASMAAALREAQSSFEACTGCALNETACIAAVAEAATLQMSNATSEAQHAFMTAVGCPRTDEDCLLLRAHELAVALSIVASTAVIVSVG